ncbi:glutaminase domain-containing protein [Candidatus Enterococcus huntleyi]|uniref:glutaminase domain-containing protein n=1 Tax=Candidatus Enterococcus huntleyi TaxID=1857217 RepID=UPI001F472668|nr:DUF4965 domain-containing protein [Enterococcus sp. JM4C]
MKVNRVASVPLILSDPYFSIWSPADCLYDTDTQSWTGKEMPVRGFIQVNDTTFRFMGDDLLIPEIPQTNLEITPTQTIYQFENELICLEVIFSTNLDLQDLQKISEPVTIITTNLTKKQPDLQVNVTWQFSEKICCDTTIEADMNWRHVKTEKSDIVWMGKAKQTPLNSTGDLIDIDWGYLYIAATTDQQIKANKNLEMLTVSYPLDSQTKFLIAYDDIVSIQYFGHYRPALWREKYTSMVELLENYLTQLEENYQNCCQIDETIQKQVRLAGGESLELITTMSYRQSICAHKLIRDEEGEIIFLSKECSSNGCIGTVDISYPSAPLYFLYQPELIKGMLRGVYRFAELDVWEYDFAPHDIGRYPYATGQLYGTNFHEGAVDGLAPKARDTIFDIYTLPKGQDVYRDKEQMPIEESGNMIILSSVLYLLHDDKNFFNKYLTRNLKWASYLERWGQNPENQLCTDDFAGHLAQNANLSLKAIVALALLGKALEKNGDAQGEDYIKTAKKMADVWQEMAKENGHTRLAFNQEDSWSMKYNIVWDYLFDLDLFPKELIDQELQTYAGKANRYGIPLDNRESYTKADWIIWVSVLTEDAQLAEEMLAPIAAYIKETETRVPFSDWYDTISGRQMNFKNRSVVGASFMPLLKQKIMTSDK